MWPCTPRPRAGSNVFIPSRSIHSPTVVSFRAPMPRTRSGSHARRKSPLHAGRLLSVSLLSAFSTAVSCQNPAPRAGSAQASLSFQTSPDLNDYVAIDRTISFPESAPSSAVEVFLDSLPGFVVADAAQSQIRAYTDDARLIWRAGQAGPGPKEFQRLRSAVRTTTGNVVALDNAGRISIWDSHGNWQRTFTTRLSPTYASILIDDSTLLISGRFGSDPSSKLLHFFDLRRGVITRSFFDVPPHRAEFNDAYMVSGWANAAVVGRDTLGVIFALSDTLYLYHMNGTPIRQFPLDLRHFRRIEKPAPENDSPEAQIAWRNSYTRILQVFRGGQDDMYVQYGNMRQRDRIWGLARFQLTPGTLDRRFEVPNTRRLLGISPRNANFYFMDVEDMEITSWSVGHLR